MGGHARYLLGRCGLMVAVVCFAAGTVSVGTANGGAAAGDVAGWTAVSAVPQASSPAVATIAGDGRIFVMGGSGTQVDAYSPESDTWAAVAPYPAGTLFAPALASVRGHVYVVGGEQLSRGRTDLVYEYDPAHDRWQPRAPIPAALTAPTGVVTVRDQIYIVGGTLQSGFLNRVVYRYDATADRWTVATRLPRPLVDHSNPVFAIGRRIYVVAWPRRPFVLNQTVYSYDTVTGRWRQEAPYKLGKRLALPSLAVVGRRVWIVGGFDDTLSPMLTNAVRVYDPRSGKLRPSPRFPEKRAGAAVIYDRAQHALYAFAGVTVHGDETPTATDHAYMLRLREFRKDTPT